MDHSQPWVKQSAEGNTKKRGARHHVLHCTNDNLCLGPVKYLEWFENVTSSRAEQDQGQTNLYSYI